MKTITTYLTFFTLLITLPILAQVGIGTTTPDPSAIMDITAIDKGLLIPRVLLDDVNNDMIDGTNPVADGMLIWNTNAATTGGSGIGFYVFTGAVWERLNTGAAIVDEELVRRRHNNAAQ